MKHRTFARKLLRNRMHPVTAVGVGLGLTQIANIATTTWLHRSLAHNAVSYDNRVVKLFDIIIRCTTGMEPNEWAAVHQQHHAHSDEPGDPHAPVLDGLARVQFGNVGEYKRAAKTEAVLRRRSLLSPTPYEHLWILQRGRGLILGIGAAVLIAGPTSGAIIALVHWPMYIGGSASVNASHAAYDHAIAVKQGRLSHYLWHFYKALGSRPHATPEFSTNQPWLAWLTMGEGLHNNHHYLPNSPTFALDRGEIDLGWYVIRGLEKLGLAKIDAKATKLIPQS